MASSRKEHSEVAASFADFYRNSRYADFAQEHRAYQAADIRAFVVDQRPHDFVDIATPEWVLGLPLSASCATSFDFGDGWRRLKRARGDFLLVPPRTEVRYDIAGPTKLLVLTWGEGALNRLDGDVFADEQAALGPLVARYFRSSPLEAMCRALWLEMARRDDAAPLLIRGLFAQFGGTMLRLARQQSSVGPQTRHEIRRVLAFIDANLESDVSLSDLAEVAGLSVFHFAREFQAQVGISPVRYVQRLRAERASALLSSTGSKPDAVARKAGFPSVRSMRLALQRFATNS